MRAVNVHSIVVIKVSTKVWKVSGSVSGIRLQNVVEYMRKSPSDEKIDSPFLSSFAKDRWPPSIRRGRRKHNVLISRRDLRNYN